VCFVRSETKDWFKWQTPHAYISYIIHHTSHIIHHTSYIPMHAVCLLLRWCHHRCWFDLRYDSTASFSHSTRPVNLRMRDDRLDSIYGRPFINITHHTSYITHHTSYIIQHTSYIIHHTSYIIHPFRTLSSVVSYLRKINQRKDSLQLVVDHLHQGHTMSDLMMFIM